MAAMLLLACDGEGTGESADEKPIRGLVATQVADTERTVARRFPGVLEPSEITVLSFETAGKLGAIDLSVGQRVAEGDVLARLETERFETEIENLQAAVDEATITLEQERGDLARFETLFARGVTTRVNRDNAASDFRRARTRLTQAEKALEAARESLDDAVMVAPFDGIINSVDVDSFATVAAGTPITSLYSASAYEVSFSVNFEAVSRLVVGTPATVRLADDPDVALRAVVSELGERADTVSSFPVVVTLRESHPLIRAGMAVEVGLEFPLPAEEGFRLPISAAITEGLIPEGARAGNPIPMEVFVYDPETETVVRREIVMRGIRENDFLIIDGLVPGEFVATAGVSFLRDGMRVKLLSPEE